MEFEGFAVEKDAIKLSQTCLLKQFLLIFQKRIKFAGFEDYDKDGVQIFKSTIHLVDTACKHASLLMSKQLENPKKDPFTNVHLLIKRLLILKEKQNYFGKPNKS